MAGATRTIVVNAPPEKFWDVITAYDKYSEFLPEVKNVRAERNGNVVTLHYELNLIKTIKYSIKMVEDRPKSARWTFIQGEFMKDNKGSWELKPTADGKQTEATYSVEVGLGMLVPSSVSNALIDKSLPAMLEAFKKRAEANV